MGGTHTGWGDSHRLGGFTQAGGTHTGWRDSHRLEGLILEYEGVVVAKLLEDLPGGLMSPTLDK